MGRPLPRRGAGRDGRPVLARRTASPTGPRPRWSARSCTCAGSSGWARSQIADRLGMPASTVHAVLVRCRLNRLTHIDRATGEPIRRYEHDHPGDLIHVDVKKLGKIPDGGGWRYVGTPAGRAEPGRDRRAHRRTTQQAPQPADRDLLPAHRHRRPLPRRLRRGPRRRDQARPPPPSCATRSPGSPTAASPSQRVLSDNGGCYRSHLWRDTCAELGITPKRTRPYRPQTNGKIERFHRTLADGWAFKKFYNSESARLAALPAWLHQYNHHRPHSAIGKAATHHPVEQPGWASPPLDPRRARSLGVSETLALRSTDWNCLPRVRAPTMGISAPTSPPRRELGHARQRDLHVGARRPTA